MYFTQMDVRATFTSVTKFLMFSIALVTQRRLED